MRVLILLLALPLLAQAPASHQVHSMKAIIGATVVDPGGARIPDAVVLLDDGRIAQVGPRSKVKIPDGAERVEAKGQFLVPGYIDAHVHFFQSGGLYTRPDAFDLRAHKPYAEDQREIRAGQQDTFARYLRCGVTSVADVGGPMLNFEVRDLAAKSDRAPRVAVAGPLISSISRDALDLGDPPIIKCATADEAIALVRREAERKPDFIKIWYVVTPQETVEKNRPVVKAAIQESHRLGFRVAVHATELASATAALEEGADILVHSVMDKEVDANFLKLAKDRKAIYCPTLIVSEDYSRTANQQFDFCDEELAWGDPFALGTLFDVRHLSGSAMADRLRKMLETPKPIQPNPVLARNLIRVMKARIPIAMGTDAGNIGTLHGPSIFREMATMEAAGMTPLEVLKAATVGGALLMGHADLGRITPGALADLVLLEADPSLSVKNFSHIAKVIRSGRVFDPATLIPDGPEALAQRQLDAYNARNLEAFCAPYSDDVQIIGLDGKEQVRGKEAFKALYRDRFQKLTALHCQLVKRMVVGNYVLDEEAVTGTGSDPIHAVAIYEVKHGKIAVVRFIR